MMKRLMIAVCALALAAPALAQQPAAQVARREVGNIILEDVPEIPADLRERLDRYQNARSAGFQDWLADGSMLITTRFGETAQVHRVAAPGMARTQLTFFSEPVQGADAQPGAERFVY